MRAPRRAVLAAGTTALALALAGCLRDSSNDRDRPSGSPSSVEYDATHFAASFTVPDWADSAGPSPGHLRALASTDGAMEPLDFEEVDDDRRHDVEGFVEETDFESEFLLYVASEGPNSNYRSVEVRSVDVTDGVVVGNAEIRSEDESGADEAPMYPSTLVRVTPDEGWPNAVEMTIVDGWDNEETFEENP